MKNADDVLYETYPELSRMPLADSVAYLARQLLLLKRNGRRQT